MKPMGLLPSRKVVPLHRRAKHARHAPWQAAVARMEARVAELERGMDALDRRMTALGKHGRMKVSFALSLLIHLVILFGISFTLPDISKMLAQQPLEVTLVNAKTQTRPQKADALAQANLDGGGNTDEKRRARNPLPLPPEDKQGAELAVAQKRVEQLERQAKQLMTQPKSRTSVASVPETPQPKQQEQAAPDTADIVARGLEMARLEAQIAREWENYQQRPRRRFVGARTQEYHLARYIEDWRAKVERVGEFNYPQAASNQQIYGRLMVTVSIKSDGTLENVEISQSSGQRILDAAAIRIIQLAAPYAPFSPDMAKEMDILSITRAITFTRSDRVVAE